MNFVCKTVMILLSISMGTIAIRAQPLKLPKRTGPLPYVSSHVPHVQVGVEPDPEISKELLRRVSNMPGIEIRDTVMSMPGALGFRLAKDVELARPDLGVRQREFAHMHPDGSLHAFLSPELAVRAVNAGWGAHHPYSGKWPKFKGFVMIFTPMTKSDLRVVLQFVRESYKLVTTKL
ncbi:MAG: luciferase family protein [Hyphomicrobiaceae bacterium]